MWNKLDFRSLVHFSLSWCANYISRGLASGLIELIDFGGYYLRAMRILSTVRLWWRKEFGKCVPDTVASIHIKRIILGAECLANGMVLTWLVKMASNLDLNPMA